MNTSLPHRKLATTTVHIMALDGIVNVNSLFTLAVFLGISYNLVDPNYTLIDGATTCAASPAIAEDFVAFHVYSFSSFLFSSLIAVSLKQAIRMAKNGDDGSTVRDIAHVNMRVLRAGILSSAVGSALGCAFLTMALVNLVQMKLGTLDCLGFYSWAAVGPLVILVPSALMIYMYIVLHTFTR